MLLTTWFSAYEAETVVQQSSKLDTLGASKINCGGRSDWFNSENVGRNDGSMHFGERMPLALLIAPGTIPGIMPGTMVQQQESLYDVCAVVHQS